MRTHNRPLYFDNFRNRAKPLQPYEEVGEGVKLNYSHDSAMRIETQVAPICSGGVEALHLYCDQRGADDWLSLEIDIDAEVKVLSLHLRYAPAERVFLSALGYGGGGTARYNLEAVKIPDHDFKMKFEILPILERFSRRPEKLRIMMLFPALTWFRLAISEIKEQK